MRSRCALIPSRGDPITFRLVMYFYEKIWHDEVDKLYINVNSQIDPVVVDFMRKYCTKFPNVVFTHSTNALDHGGSITKMFHESTEDNIVLMEDDSFVYGHGMVDKYFQMIEANAVDACGSLRGCCSGEITDRGKLYFELWDEKFAGGELWFWPCFFFCKRSDLLKTDLNFCGKGWKPGEYIAPLQWTTPMEVCGDTMVYMSMQLRALKLRFHDFPNPYLVGSPDYQWTHTNSLSSFIESMLTDDNDYPLAFRKTARPPVVKETVLIGDPGEYERKFAWMTMALEKFWDEFEEIKEFRDLYKKGIYKYAERFGFNWGRIEEMKGRYHDAIGL